MLVSMGARSIPCTKIKPTPWPEAMIFIINSVNAYNLRKAIFSLA